MDDAQNRRKRTSTHEWAHQWPHEWVHEWPHEWPHESSTRAPTRADFPVFSPSRTPHETSHEGVHGRAHEWTVGVHLSCFHLFCSLTNQCSYGWRFRIEVASDLNPQRFESHAISTVSSILMSSVKVQIVLYLVIVL